MKQPEDEKRAFVRVPFRMETSVRTKDRTIWSSSTLDISMNGLRVATTETAPPEGTPCEIEIVLAELAQAPRSRRSGQRTRCAQSRSCNASCARSHSIGLWIGVACPACLGWTREASGNAG